MPKSKPSKSKRKPAAEDILEPAPLPPGMVRPSFVRAEVVVTTEADEEVSLRTVWPPAHRPK
jgi:hypothetical protein